MKPLVTYSPRMPSAPAGRIQAVDSFGCARVRPSRTISLVSALAGVGLITFCVFVAFWWPSDLPAFFPIFLILSVLPATIMTLYHCVNLFTGKGLTWEIIDVGGVPRSEMTPAERLKELAQLRADGLISDAEFEQKRKAILERL